MLRSDIQGASENHLDRSHSIGSASRSAEQQSYIPRLDKESAVITGTEFGQETTAKPSVSEFACEHQAQPIRNELEMAKEHSPSAANSQQPFGTFSRATTIQSHEIAHPAPGGANLEFQNVSQRTSAFVGSCADQPVASVAPNAQGRFFCRQEPLDAQSLSRPTAEEQHQRYQFVPSDPISTLQMASNMTNEQLTNALSRELEEQARAASANGPSRDNVTGLGAQHSRSGAPVSLHRGGVPQQQNTTSFAPENALERMVRRGQAIPLPTPQNQCPNPPPSLHLDFDSTRRLYENQLQQSQLAASSYQHPSLYANSHVPHRPPSDLVTPSLPYQGQSSPDSILRQQLLQNVNVGDHRYVDERYGRAGISSADQARLLLGHHQQREWDQQQSVAIALGRQEQQMRQQQAAAVARHHQQQQLDFVHHQQQLPHNPQLAPMNLPTLAHENPQPLASTPQSPLDILAAVSQMQLDSQQR